MILQIYSVGQPIELILKNKINNFSILNILYFALKYIHEICTTKAKSSLSTNLAQAQQTLAQLNQA